MTKEWLPMPVSFELPEIGWYWERQDSNLRRKPFSSFASNYIQLHFTPLGISLVISVVLRTSTKNQYALN